MNIMLNLFALYNDTARDDTYHKAIEGILRNMDKLEDASIFELADLCLVSKATIERLIRKLGYRSLPQFRHDLSEVCRKYTYFNRVLPLKQCQNDPQMIDAYFGSLRGIIDSLASSVDLQEIHRIADALHEARRVCFYTAGRCYAEIPLQISLAVSGKESIVLTRYADQLEDARTLDSSCLVFIFTVDFQNVLDMRPVFAEAAGRGARIALATTNEISQYREYVDFQIVSKYTETLISDYGMQMNIDLIDLVYRKKYIDKI